MGSKVFFLTTFLFGFSAFANPFKCDDVSAIEYELIQRNLLGLHVPTTATTCDISKLKTLLFEQQLTGGMSGFKIHEKIPKNSKIEILPNSKTIGSLTTIHFTVSWVDGVGKNKKIKDSLTYELYTKDNQAEYGCALEASPPTKLIVYKECFP